MLKPIFGFVLLLIFLYLWKQKAFYLLHWKLKGPWGLPFIGMALHLGNKETSLKVMENLVKIYSSTFVTWLGPKCCLYSSDPDTIEKLLKSENCINKNSVYDFLHDIIGNGLFTRNGPSWYLRSKFMKPAFKRKALFNFFSVFNKESNFLIKKVETDKHLQDGSKLFSFIQLMTLKVTFQTTLGCTSEDADMKFTSIVKPFHILTERIIDRIYQPFYHNRTLYHLTPHCKRTEKLKNFLNSVLEEEIKKKEAEIKNRNYNQLNGSDRSRRMNFGTSNITFKEKSFLEYILNRNNCSNMNLEEIRSEIATLISGGFETTAVVMYTTILCLAMFPEKQEKLFQDLCSQFTYKNFDIDEEDNKKLIYLELCINEAMRVIAPVPIIGRITTKEILLKNGIKVPKGTDLIIDIFNMQRNTKFWGANAKEFNPENFQPENLRNQHPYAFIPFTKGIRMCIGFQYAFILMKIFLAKLFRNFKITTDMKFEDLIFVNSLSIKYKIHPKLKIVMREY